MEKSVVLKDFGQDCLFLSSFPLISIAKENKVKWSVIANLKADFIRDVSQVHLATRFECLAVQRLVQDLCPTKRESERSGKTLRER